VFVPAAAVGAVGVPVNAGLARSALRLSLACDNVLALALADVA